LIGNDWDVLLETVWKSEGFNKFMDVIKKEYDNYTCFPQFENIFNALVLTPYSKVKVVILGQDPYHGVGEAHGLSFSVQTIFNLFRKDYEKRHKNYFEYKESRSEKKYDFVYIVICGAIFLVIGIIMMLLYKTYL